jgi:hypothetical protein
MVNVSEPPSTIFMAPMASMWQRLSNLFQKEFCCRPNYTNGNTTKCQCLANIHRNWHGSTEHDGCDDPIEAALLLSAEFEGLKHDAQARVWMIRKIGCWKEKRLVLYNTESRGLAPFICENALQNILYVTKREWREVREGMDKEELRAKELRCLFYNAVMRTRVVGSIPTISDWEGIVVAMAKEAKTRTPKTPSAVSKMHHRNLKDILHIPGQLEFEHLLRDSSGQRRGVEISVCTELLRLLREVFDSTKLRDYVTHSRNIIYRSSNLSAGITAAVVDAKPNISKTDRSTLEGLEKTCVNNIKTALCEMDYCSVDEQDIKVFLTFMKTVRTSVQDPHIDFSWADAYPHGSADDAGAPNNHYRWNVPFIAFFPLSTEGMFLEMWDHRPNHGVIMDSSETETKRGRMLYIPHGRMLMVRADTVHAGGFTTNETVGSPRCHLYIHKAAPKRYGKAGEGTMHDLRPKNIYRTQDAPSSSELKMAYLHSHEVACPIFA